MQASRKEYRMITLRERIAYRIIIFLTRYLTALGLESAQEEMDEVHIK